MIIRSIGTVWLCVTLSCLFATSRDTGVGAQGGRFTTGIEMVPLTVAVTDPKGHYVTGLTVDDFRIFEDGVAQPMSFFANDEVPLDLGLLLDTSGSMSLNLPLVRAAAGGLVRRLGQSDRGAVVQVSDIASVAQAFTTDLTKVTDAIGRISMSGSTALYDSMYIVLREFERERHASAGIRRQALVLVSDGVDNKSSLSADDVVDLTRRVGVNVYVIAMKPDFPARRSQLDGAVLNAEYTMGVVARESGGRTYFPRAAGELTAICTAITQELASQYQLGYVPRRAGGDGGFRRVTVQVDAGAGARARTRSGYYSMRPAQAGR